MRRRPVFAPERIFKQVLAYAVIPTFDLILWFEGRGIAIFRRKIPPYKNLWALPGLRMMKLEGIEDTLVRIARQEAGVIIDPKRRIFIDQYVGRFRSENRRQDLSTCYAFLSVRGNVTPNPAHFYSLRFIASVKDMPKKMGAMYRHYLKKFFAAYQDRLR